MAEDADRVVICMVSFCDTRRGYRLPERSWREGRSAGVRSIHFLCKHFVDVLPESGQED